MLNLVSGRGQSLLALNTPVRRHESSYRRSKQRLNVKPDSSFLLSNNSPQRDHIIYNPPAAAPSVLHTPVKFLPKEDQRAQLHAAKQAELNSKPVRLGPPLKLRNDVPHNHLSDTDIAEIQKLRREEPEYWSAARLGRKFNCSQMFITICVKESGADNVLTRQHWERIDASRSRWGPRRRMAYEDKLRRKDAALRDE